MSGAGATASTCTALPGRSDRRGVRRCRRLAAACGGSTGPGVADLGTSPTAGPGSSTARTGSATSSHGSSDKSFFAYVSCMHAHGEPNMPSPTIGHEGGHVSVGLSVTPGSGFNPRSPRFTAANAACKHLVATPSGVHRTLTITPADRTDYRKAAACMRSHGFPDFPGPVFEDDSVVPYSSPSSS